MGDINQFTFVGKFVNELKAPFLEVGSKDYGSTQNFRPLFAGKGEYVGVDMEDGPGVDVVLDLTDEFQKVDAKLSGKRFSTVICLSVLEHCDQPFKIAENLMRLMKPGGWICIGVPFSWKIHAYPNDYWRFTPEGIRKLFYKVQFDMKRSRAATSKEDEFMEIDDEIGKIPFSFTMHKNKGHIIRGISAKILKQLSRIGFLSWLTGYYYVHAPTNIMMVGRLKSD